LHYVDLEHRAAVAKEALGDYTEFILRSYIEISSDKECENQA